MEAALGAIALATTVKDMVELGQTVHESFAKVSRNLRGAQRVAENIKEMVEEINNFLQSHEELLANMKDFGMALQDLLQKFRDFETSILPLLPKTGQRRYEHFIRGWWNNNKIQENILNLESEIVKLMRGYMWKSTLRTEVKQEMNHQKIIKGLTDVRNDVTQALAVVDNHKPEVSTTATHLCSYKLHEMANQDADSNIVMFALSTPSTSVPMLRNPTVITEEVATTMYIKVQIDHIAAMIEKLSIISIAAPDSVDRFSPTAIIETASISILHLRHHVVREVTHIRDFLEVEHIQPISLAHGVTALNNLSLALDILDMHHESIRIGRCTITLARKLVTLSPKNFDLGANLAFYLLNQSTSYFNTGNNSQSLRAIEEADTIARDLLNDYGPESRLLILQSHIMMQYARLMDNKCSINLTAKAVQILEGVLDVQEFSQSTLYTQTRSLVVHPESFSEKLFATAPDNAYLVLSYAQALQQLAEHLFIDRGHPEHASDLILLAVAIHQKLVSVYGTEYTPHLAKSLSDIRVQDGITSGIPPEELLGLANECIRFLHDMSDKNPVYHAQELVNVMWVKAYTLERLEQDTEAIAVWEEITRLAGQVVQDSALCAHAFLHLSDQFWRLKKNYDAAHTRILAVTTYQGNKAETEALNFFNLSKDLQHLGCYKESVEAAEKSVVLLQNLAIKEPEKWAGQLIESFSNLAYCLSSMGSYPAALIAWKESLSIANYFLDAHIQTDFPWDAQIIEILHNSFQIHQKIGYILEDEDEYLKVCCTSVQQLRKLAEIWPQNDIIELLFRVEFHYAYNMLRVGHTQKAQQYIDNLAEEWGRRAQKLTQSTTMQAWHAKLINLKVDVSDVLGCTKQAILTVHAGLDIVKHSVEGSQLCLLETVKSIHQEARLHGSHGDSKKALRVAEWALQLARDSQSRPDIDALVWSLHAVACSALLHRDYNRAVEAAREGCKITNSPEWEEDEFNIFMRPSLLAILSSAEANAGRISMALEYAHCAVEVSIDIRDRKPDISATTAERSYMETRWNLAEVLLAAGDIFQALQICEEQSSYYSQRVDARVGDYRELAPRLRMLGILCCSEGRHEQGAVAAKELSRIIKILESIFPSLQEEVKIRLRRQVQMPVFKILGEMSEKLQCGHQDVGSLFEM